MWHCLPQVSAVHLQLLLLGKKSYTLTSPSSSSWSPALGAQPNFQTPARCGD